MKIIPSIFLAALLSGCTPITGSAMQKLKPGMTKAQALKITGPSDGYTLEGKQEIYTYTDRFIRGDSPNRGDFQATFTNGILTSWGNTGVRKANVGLVGVYGAVNTY